MKRDFRIYVLILFSWIILVYASYPHFKNGNNIGMSTTFFIDVHNNEIEVSQNIPTNLVNRVSSTNAPILYQKININEADEFLLQTIPGIGPQLARRIIEEKKRIGFFQTEKELQNVKGIGTKRRTLLMENLRFE